jgi:hypothetical protein
MVILKKVDASTLIETVTASILIVIVFTIASLTLNNVFATAIKNDTNQVENHIYMLEYQFINNKVLIPYSESYNNWEINIFKENESSNKWIVFKAENTYTKKRVIKKVINVQE